MERRHETRRRQVAGLVAASTFLLMMVPLLRPAEPVEQPLLPSTIAKYSWLTGSLSSSPIDAATLLYQNGFDVEFGDFGQQVMLGADGTSYRRLDLAEKLSTGEDQGDPAESALSPDGTFALVGGSGATGELHVVRLRDGDRRAIPVGEGRTTLPLSIGADGRTALLATREGEHVRYAGRGDLGLSGLDLATGDLHEYAEQKGVYDAALSPDGTTIAVETRRHIRLVDAADGRELTRLDLPRAATIDGDSWSPDGSQLAVAVNGRLAIVDAEDPSSPRMLKLDKVGYGYVAGWRDESTVLLHVHDYQGLDRYDNQSFLAWVDTTTGDLERIAFYAPNWTGAAMGTVDAARDLIGTWQVADDLPVDRGAPPLTLAALTSLLAGFVAYLALLIVYPLRRRPSPPPPEPAQELTPA